MAKRRNYKNAPLIEALCQIQFQPGAEWDLAIPGLLYSKIQEEFPKRRQQEAIEFLVRGDLKEFKHKKAVDRVQFLRDDEKALVQVGQDSLVINVLRPYPRWENFRAMIESLVESYRQVAEPQGISALAL